MHNALKDNKEKLENLKDEMEKFLESEKTTAADIQKVIRWLAHTQLAHTDTWGPSISSYWNIMMNLNALLKIVWLVPDSCDYPDTNEYHFSATNDLSLPISDNELDTLIDDLSLALNQINLDGADLDVVLPG